MKVYVDEKTGYLIMEDISEDIEIIPTKEYLDMQERLIEAEKWAKKLWEDAEHNNAVSDGVNRAVGYFGGKMNNPCVLGAKGKKVYKHMIKNKEVFKKRIPEIAQKYEFEDD